MKFLSFSLLTTAAVVVAATTTLPTTNALEVGDNICVEGFIMDFFCIDRGTLLDNPSVRTLENPERHSVHCLVDVGSCVRSPFEVLLDPTDATDGLYSRGFRFTEDSKQDIIALARDTGRTPSCSTCTGAGGLREGFRAVLNATVVNIDDPDVPPIISYNGAFHSNGLENPCSLFNMSDVLDTKNATDFGIVGVESNLQQKHYAHAICMLIGWGFLLPTGAIFARFFKHRPDGIWFKIHRALQSVGLFIALIGWIIALRNFQVFADIGYNNFRHGVCGSVTMILGILQPINAICRPHPPKDGEEKTSARAGWELLHKGMGYSAIVLAIVTIGLGTTILPNPDDQTRFQLAYGIGCGGILLFVMLALQQDKRSYVNGNEENETKPTQEQPLPEADDAEKE